MKTQTKKRIGTLLICIGFFLLLGTAGALELDTIAGDKMAIQLAWGVLLTVIGAVIRWIYK